MLGLSGKPMLASQQLDFAKSFHGIQSSAARKPLLFIIIASSAGKSGGGGGGGREGLCVCVYFCVCEFWSAVSFLAFLFRHCGHFQEPLSKTFPLSKHDVQSWL